MTGRVGSVGYEGLRLLIHMWDERPNQTTPPTSLAPEQVDPALLKAIARARCWFEEVASGRVQSLVEIARRQGLPKRYVTRLARLAFVSPMIAEAIAGGRAPAGINLQMLMDGRLALPADWKDQQPML